MSYLRRHTVRPSKMRFFFRDNDLKRISSRIKDSSSWCVTNPLVHTNGLPVSQRTIVGCLLACALLAGCSIVEKYPVLWSTNPAPVPHAEKHIAAKNAPSPIIILVSDDLPAYSAVVNDIRKKLTKQPIIINLKGNAVTDTVTPELLHQTDKHQVVAVGLIATQTAMRLNASQVVFCKVFNYSMLSQGNKNTRGISFLPPVELQFRAWKKLDPELKRVGVITGPGHERLIEEAQKAAKHHGILLLHRTVQTDMEMLYDFKRLTPEIQGLWLLPDNRILSRRILREVMSYSTKHQLEVVVFHPALLRFGGLMSIDSVDADVANQVITALQDKSKRTAASVDELLPLKQLDIEVNNQVAQSITRQSKPKPRVAANAD
jgi:ABC-type uncharacterized transport system substrate-binding protein